MICIAPSSNAADLGVQVSNIIAEINAVEIKNHTDISKVLSDAKFRSQGRNLPY